MVITDPYQFGVVVAAAMDCNIVKAAGSKAKKEILRYYSKEKGETFSDEIRSGMAYGASASGYDNNLDICATLEDDLRDIEGAIAFIEKIATGALSATAPDKQTNKIKEVQKESPDSNPAPRQQVTVASGSVAVSLTKSATRNFTEYLSFRPNKAFAISPATGAWGSSWGKPSTESAIGGALNGCKKRSNDCRIYAVGNELVYKILDNSVTRLSQSYYTDVRKMKYLNRVASYILRLSRDRLMEMNVLSNDSKHEEIRRISKIYKRVRLPNNTTLQHISEYSVVPLTSVEEIIEDLKIAGILDIEKDVVQIIDLYELNLLLTTERK